MANLTQVTDQDLVNQVMPLIQVDPTLRKLVEEVVRWWDVLMQALAQQQPQPQVTQQGQGNTIATLKLKLDQPGKYEGDPSKLQNFLFDVEQFCTVLGFEMDYKPVKLSVILLAKKAQTWWRSVSSEQWAQLGTLKWQEFKVRIGQAFQDPNHELQTRQQLATLCQKTSIQVYSSIFRELLLEVQQTMSDNDVLFTYLAGLKPQVQQQVRLHSPPTVEAAMQLADHADSTMWLAGHSGTQSNNYHKQPFQSCQQPTFLPAHGPVPKELGAAQGKRQACTGPQQHQPMRCYQCGKLGHIRRNCPKEAQRTGHANVVTIVPPPLPPPPRDQGAITAVSCYQSSCYATGQ